MSDAFFAPIASTGASKPAKLAPDLVSVVPVPADAPVPLKRHPSHGEPVYRWPYLGANGELLGYACRFVRADGSKTYQPLTLFREGASGSLKWKWKGWVEPRPLYGLNKLAARPGAPVLLCEGEKATDAAGDLVPDYVAVTSPNGCKSAGKADWSVLRGRHVVIWPDADAPGEDYATEAASLVLAAGAASVARLTPPGGVKAGWDAADALAEGWTQERTAVFLVGARATVCEASPEAARVRPAKKAQARPGAVDDEGDGKRGPGRPSWHDILAEITSEFTLWHSPRKAAFASVTMPAGHRENMALRSEAFLRLLRLRAHEKTGRPAPKSNLDDTIALLEAQAIAHGEEQEEWLRVGRRDGNLYVDLGCRQWRAVEITPRGVSILNSHTLPFVRSEGMLALPEPEFGSERGIDELRDFVNAESDTDFKLIVAWTLHALCKSKEFALLVLNGEQGTGKSTLTRTLASLVDPHELDIMAPPEEAEDLFVIAQHAHLLPIDNLSKIDGSMSDALCRIASGGTYAGRTLFSNSGLTLLKAARPALLNGIPSLTDRPDLAQRTVTVRLRPIPEEERKVSDDMAARWEEVRPRILGTLLEAISSGLRDEPSIRLERLPRMAGFARFVVACAPGLGFDRDELLAAYSANQTELANTAFENNPVAAAVVKFMEGVPDGEWRGTPTELLECLSDPQVTNERVRNSFGWPKTPQMLGTHMVRIAPALRARGIDAQQRKSGKMFWDIRKA